VAAAAGRPAILALIETRPEDIRGMHAALGVLTVRGGMTSHAALVARGLGRPCVVGVKDLDLDRKAGKLRVRGDRGGGRVFGEGDVVTVDGGEGQVLLGRVETVPPEITGAFATLMEWADAERRMGVRANADTGQDASIARVFNAEGIGLCRTEHMFFQRGRISAMREMILADTEATRRRALDKLLPMQRADFIDLFQAMAGLPVVIRMLDPPLHEFLPHGKAEMAEVAESLDVPVSKVKARAAELAEFNPMLGNRGCRIGIAYPEIYQMQARAIFEAACEAGRRTGQPVRPEIMIPLVSAVRELELLKLHIEAVAAEVRAERGEMVDYHVGVMIETPRAALRAADIADKADFLSFGTNDLTQLVYGLSRDDAGRFIPNYVAQQVYPHDPFHTLDLEGVGEIMRIATDRARSRRPEISIGLCGEHGGDPDSVQFCEDSGFDYVSCSPFRVPIARLAAAQATIRARRNGIGRGGKSK
jgi:pyruvate,orthophosphate dikinase